jgi:predicted glycosyltransferase
VTAPLHMVMVVQNLMGVGHQRRAAALCAAASEQGWRTTLVSGGFPMRGFDAGTSEFVQLPPARCPDLKFDRLVDIDGQPVDDAWCKTRRECLLSAVVGRTPDVVVIETFPFGRKLLRFELVPLLETLRKTQNRPVIASSIRDIIEFRPKLKKYQVMADSALEYFDLVLVHSDPQLIPLAATFPPFDDIRHLVQYTGFVHEAHTPDVGSAQRSGTSGSDTDGCDEVIVSCGGGGYGEHLLRAALAARAQSKLKEKVWRILVGENVPAEQFESLRREASAGVVVERTRSDFRTLLSRAAVSVSQGGYNTVMDVLEGRVRSVVVAYHDETEREQLLRAQLLAEREWVHLLRNDELTPQSLAAVIDHAATAQVPDVAIDFDGANTSVKLLTEAVMASRLGAIQ